MTERDDQEALTVEPVVSANRAREFRWYHFLLGFVLTLPILLGSLASPDSQLELPAKGSKWWILIAAIAVIFWGGLIALAVWFVSGWIRG